MEEIIGDAQSITTKNHKDEKKQEDNKTKPCQICYGTPTTRNVNVICPKCSVNCCMTCCKTYLLDSMEFPNCMVCKTEWSRSFLSKNFPKTWLTDTYKKHCENIIEERHDAILHNYQPYVVSINRIEEYTQQKIKLNIQLINLQKQIFKVDRRIYNERNI